MNNDFMIKSEVAALARQNPSAVISACVGVSLCAQVSQHETVNPQPSRIGKRSVTIYLPEDI